MLLKIDLKGVKYGKWTITDRVPREKGTTGQVKWICQCECGTEIIMGTHYIRNEWNSEDCGCSKDMVGKRFSHLTIIKRLGKD